MKRSKRYAELAKSYDKHELVDVATAVKQIKSFDNAKFDETVEMHFRLGVDGRHADQQVRGAMVLPPGADFVGAEDMAEKIQKENWFDFDAVVATPDMMGVVGRLGKILGPRGMMPNPKSGTVTMDLTKALADIKAGKVEYRLDKSNIIHCIIGKKSFTEEQLVENANALIQAIAKAKPAAAKGQYFKSISIAATMSPGVKINPATVVL